MLRVLFLSLVLAEAVQADILKEGDRITAVGSDLPASGATVIDLGGATVLPGLFDLHTLLLASVVAVLGVKGTSS